MRSMATIHELQVDFICLLHFLLSARRERLSIQTRLRQSRRFNFLDHRGLVELTTAASPRDCLLFFFFFFPSGKGEEIITIMLTKASFAVISVVCFVVVPAHGVPIIDR